MHNNDVFANYWVHIGSILGPLLGWNGTDKGQEDENHGPPEPGSQRLCEKRVAILSKEDLASQGLYIGRGWKLHKSLQIQGNCQAYVLKVREDAMVNPTSVRMSTYGWNPRWLISTRKLWTEGGKWNGARWTVDSSSTVQQQSWLRLCSQIFYLLIYLKNNLFDLIWFIIA